MDEGWIKHFSISIFGLNVRGNITCQLRTEEAPNAEEGVIKTKALAPCSRLSLAYFN